MKIRSQQIKVSFCIPVYNEEEILLQYLKKIRLGLTQILGKGNFEMLVIENGSTDQTVSILKNVKYPGLRIFYAPSKGHGIAYKIGIEKAKYENIVLSALDIPFGFSDLKAALPIWDNYDIIFGSKAHPKSKIYSLLERRIASFLYRIILKLLFNIPIRDTQGTMFLKKSKILPILPYCRAKNAFFTAQLALYGKRFGLKMIEIPVTYHRKHIIVRKSKYNIMLNS